MVVFAILINRLIDSEVDETSRATKELLDELSAMLDKEYEDFEVPYEGELLRRKDR